MPRQVSARRYVWVLCIDRLWVRVSALLLLINAVSGACLCFFILIHVSHSFDSFLLRQTSDLISAQLQRWPTFASDVLSRYFSAAYSSSDANAFPQQVTFKSNIFSILLHVSRTHVRTHAFTHVYVGRADAVLLCRLQQLRCQSLPAAAVNYFFPSCYMLHSGMHSLTRMHSLPFASSLFIH